MDIIKLYNAFLNSNGISIDTRTLKKGDLFFALSGPNFNGNHFAKNALEKGASFVVVDNNDSDEDVMGPVYKQVMSLAKKKVQNRTGLNWIQGELDKRKR